MAMVTTPKNALHHHAGLHAFTQLMGSALCLAQLYEHKYWGGSESNPIADPNPRVQALIEAARRGAKVRLLLDGFFDEGEALRSNQATADCLAQIASVEGIDIEAKVGNPTSGSIHAKWVLMRVDGVKWSAVGSLNGGEISYKVNREVVLIVDQTIVYDRLVEVFLQDWATATNE